jgi:hypothetical protein
MKLVHSWRLCKGNLYLSRVLGEAAWFDMVLVTWSKLFPELHDTSRERMGDSILHCVLCEAFASRWCMQVAVCWLLEPRWCSGVITAATATSQRSWSFKTQLNLCVWVTGVNIVHMCFWAFPTPALGLADFNYYLLSLVCCLTIEVHSTLHCSTLQYIAVHCSTLQYIAVHCSKLQYIALCLNIASGPWILDAVFHCRARVQLKS